MNWKTTAICCVCWLLDLSVAAGADAPVPPLEKPGWKLTFHDEFDRPQLNDMYWFAAYRSGRKEYFKRIGQESRWVDHNAHYVIEDGILKLRIDEKLPFRPDKSTPCVSCIQTSDHRFGATTAEYQILDKFAQKYGWFEIRCKCPRGEGLLSAFWLHQTDPTKQEYTPEGRRKEVGDGVVEIDIIEQQGRHIGDTQQHRGPQRSLHQGSTLPAPSRHRRIANSTSGRWSGRRGRSTGISTATSSARTKAPLRKRRCSS